MEWLWILMYAIITYIPIATFFALIPYLTRRTESFGISIPEEVYNEPELQNLRKTYRNSTLIINFLILAAAITLALLVQVKNTQMFILSMNVIAQLLVMFLFYLRGHRRMKKLKAEKNWQENKAQVVIVDTAFSQKKITVSPWWFSLYILVIMVTLGAGLYFYPRMPERVPFHFDFAGRPDGWVNKSFRVLFFIPMVQTFLLILMVFVYWIIRKAKQQVAAADAERSIEQNRVFRYRWSAFCVFMGLAMVIQSGVSQLSLLGLVDPLAFAPIFMGVSLAIVIAALILAVTTGQGGSRIKPGKTKTGETINRNEDKYWKLGVFYYNPEDPAIFVEKRFGIGWTGNMAHPLSWILLIGLFILVGLITWLSSVLTA